MLFSVLGVENAAAGPTTRVVDPRSPQDLHSHDALIAAGTIAPIADRVRTLAASRQDLFDTAVELAAIDPEQDHRPDLSGVIVDGRPSSFGRERGRLRNPARKGKHDREDAREHGSRAERAP